MEYKIIDKKINYIHIVREDGWNLRYCGNYEKRLPSLLNEFLNQTHEELKIIELKCKNNGKI